MKEKLYTTEELEMRNEVEMFKQEQCQKLLLEKANEMRKIYEEYIGVQLKDELYLSVVIIDNLIEVHNDYDKQDFEVYIHEYV